MKTNTILIAGVIVVVAAVVTVVGINSMANNDCEEADVNYRTDKDTWIIESTYTPFDAVQISRFKGLDYYPVDCKNVVEGTLEVDPQRVSVPATDGRFVELTRYGTVTVKIKKTDYTLEIYEAGSLPEFKKFPGTYFIPFKDASNSDSPDPRVGTWKNGRYLIIDIPADGNLISLDFNMATNSYEAYNGGYSSLVTPAANVLAAPLTIGERKYEDRTH